ncbi:nucleotidyltransferase family protein [Paraburkholderia megapolitana]|uniref:Molybdenum cofactor cytidylyltransferase n=1 Tax=Paraburkholderia megapolitana TaxID=420953 RepID=A0A1I3QF67_9BURK|nr:nucleotidyltransferase family protein [Paraburkholderia megapolitana]QDQ81206.1 nucleotidyltransferase family protein [Paraburkholderia megapolitana]SFJ32189.1 molybdenum cofactor cytidylyltransferase [Paraburkholderia megapolitana]
MTYVSLATGVLLAAGYGSRFDPDGIHNKLLARLPEGKSVAHEAAHRLKLIVPRVVAVVRPGSDALARELNDAGCDVVFSAAAGRGMGASLAAGVEACDDAESWIVALADMPRIATTTIEAVASALGGGASLVAPFYRNQRGHPAGFGIAHRAALLALDGDAGARALFAAHTVTRVDVDDPGILRDIDTPDDLRDLDSAHA